MAREIKAPLVDFLLGASTAPRPVTLSILKSEYDDVADNLADFPSAIRYLIKATRHGHAIESSDPRIQRIKFPYSRHSSYGELCQLLQLLKPRDVWPCTVQPVRWIREGISSSPKLDHPLL